MSDMQKDHPPLFDFYAQQRARNRAKRLDGDRFLERAAAEGLQISGKIPRRLR